MFFFFFFNGVYQESLFNPENLSKILTRLFHRFIRFFFSDFQWFDSEILSGTPSEKPSEISLKNIKINCPSTTPSPPVIFLGMLRGFFGNPWKFFKYPPDVIPDISLKIIYQSSQQLIPICRLRFQWMVRGISQDLAPQDFLHRFFHLYFYWFIQFLHKQIIQRFLQNFCIENPQRFIPKFLN